MANEEYSEMIEMPVSTCEMKVAPEKKRFKREKIVKKVNKKMAEAKKKEKCEEPVQEEAVSANEELSESSIVVYEKAKRKRGKFDIVAAQVIAVFALIVAILLTNVFWENSGINTLIKSVFSPAQTTADNRAYTAFTAIVPCSAELITAEDGVMTIDGSCSVYSLAEGKVTDVFLSEGKYAVTVSHSDSFKSIITGLDLSYVEIGDKVYSGIPVGFLSEGEGKVMMYSDNELIKNYKLSGNDIVWES